MKIYGHKDKKKRGKYEKQMEGVKETTKKIEEMEGGSRRIMAGGG